MKQTKKIISSITALMCTVSMIASAMTAAASEKLNVHNDVSESEYNLTQDTEQVFSEDTEYIENRIIFSVLDYRRADEHRFISDEDLICTDNGLYDISFVYETICDSVPEKDGFTAYEVFYTASITGDVWDKTESLKKDKHILSAEPDLLWENTAEDEYTEVTQEEIEAEKHFEQLDIVNVWNGLSHPIPGDKVVVAVIDTGVDYTHKELENNIWSNPNEIAGNGIDDDSNGFIDDIHGIDLIEDDGDPMDDQGHGTHVAGIIAMSAGNDGGVGIAYGSQIMCIKAGKADGTFSSSDIAQAIKYAADNGADVINMSFGGKGKSTLVEAALKDAYSTSVLVASAGNGGLPTSESEGGADIYPAGSEYVIGVMASDENGEIASFSNWDYAIGSGCEYNITAPGTDIYSILPGDRYASWSGTSSAAPIVSAAAAIIRREYPNKGQYPSNYIMGQLISATQKRTGEYPALDIMASLYTEPHPELSFTEFHIFDTGEISELNFYDETIQPSETVDLGFTVWNKWGNASDVTVKAEALTAEGKKSPYVEFIIDEITLDDIQMFSPTDNGYIYESEVWIPDEETGEEETYVDKSVITGVSNPIRFKVSDTVPNDEIIKICLTVTSKNGNNEIDTNVYTSIFEYEAVVKSTVYLSGVLSNMILSADKHWVIESKVTIPSGVTVTVEPGTKLEFWSAEKADTYTYENYPCIEIDPNATFVCEGTAENPIEIFPAEGFEDKNVYIGYLGQSYFTNLGYFKYVNYVNPGNEYNYMFFGTVDHCVFSDLPEKKPSDYGFYFNTAINSVLKSGNGTVENFDTSMTGSRNSAWCNGDMKNSVVQVNDNPEYEILSPYMMNCTNNAILFSEANMDMYIYEGLSNVKLQNNYFGTDDAEVIKNLFTDKSTGQSQSAQVYTPFLTLDSEELETIYPFVTEAYIVDEYGEVADVLRGGQTAQVHIKFNRDMSPDIMPEVAYGAEYPYNEYKVSGEWLNAREWSGEVAIDENINDEKLYFSIKGAAAADDTWLVTGTDAGRFSFNVEVSTIQSLNLKGKGISGASELEWYQDETETLAGYNIYRSEVYNAAQDITLQNFERVNASIVSGDESIYVDTEVTSGKTYYYYFTIMDTDFNESSPSNVISCIPLDGELPEISHTPTTNSKPETAITISADVTDNSLVDTVMLYYKNENADEWYSIEMRNISNSLYRAVISAYEVTEENIEYYITASDTVNTAYYGTKETPNIIIVEEIQSTTTTVPTSSPDGKLGDADEDGSVGISDVVLVMCYASNKSAYTISAKGLNNADVYQRGDGVGASDALSIQKFIAQVLTALPESYA